MCQHTTSYYVNEHIDNFLSSEVPLTDTKEKPQYTKERKGIPNESDFTSSVRQSSLNTDKVGVHIPLITGPSRVSTEDLLLRPMTDGTEHRVVTRQNGQNLV